MVVPDRTLNTLLKDIVLKGVVVIYSSQSPTKNKQAAIQKMLEAGEFIANNGATMDKDSFDRLGGDSLKLVSLQRDVSTGWGDLFAHPVTTYTSARKLKAKANKLLSEAQSASCRSKINEAARAREAIEVEEAARQTHAAPPVQAPQGAAIVPAHPTNVAAPPTAFSSTPLHTDFDTDRSAAGDDRAYIRLGELEMRIPLDSRTRIGFDGEILTTRFRMEPIKPLESAPGDQRVRTVKRTASVFTATGTARIVPQCDASNGDPSQNHDEEAPTTCKFEWLEGPVITALTELEDGEPDTMDSVSDSDLSSD